MERGSGGIDDRLADDLRVINARLALGLRLDPEDVERIGVELLANDVDGAAIREAAGLVRSKQMREDETAALARKLLQELGWQPLSDEDAPWVLARNVAGAMIDGHIDPVEGASTLWGLWWSCDNDDSISAMVQPLDELEVTLPADVDEQHRIRAELVDLARSVAAAADGRLRRVPDAIADD